jgi:hypothetical protein
MRSVICHCQNLTEGVPAIEPAMLWLIESLQYLKVLIPVFLQFISRATLPRFIQVYFIIVLSVLILIGFSILQAEIKRNSHLVLPSALLPTS